MKNNLRNLSIFCINVETDQMLLLEKNKGLMLTPLVLFLFVILNTIRDGEISSPQSSLKQSDAVNDSFVNTTVLFNLAVSGPSVRYVIVSASYLAK